MRRLLLDTQVLLWWRTDDPTLNRAVHEAIADPANDIFVSAVCIWEIAIKRALGRLRAPDHLAATVEAEGLNELPVTFVHAEQAGSLPKLHGDPFDRMLVAQAQVEGLTLVTADTNILRYPVRTMAARDGA
ncbi:MAG: type II toxin-antitoxin system VapC family toxin [Chloroflexota bacterium]|nr:type II toxin-antitoxin system VapC family toxin [Chloroflexota bacterium]